MKRVYLIICMVLGFCLSQASIMQAQTNNVLRVPDATATYGKTAVLPVYLDNTTEIVGIQFTLTVPKGMTLDAEEFVLGIRGEDHVANIKEMEANKYLCMVYSPTNKPLRGNSGKLFDINFTIADVFDDGSIHPMTLEDVVLGDAEANNVMTSYSVGNLLIANGPDLVVQSIEVEGAELTPNGTINVSWIVANESEQPTTGGWKEQVYLVNEEGTQTLIGTVYNDAMLAGNGQSIRSASFKLPLLMGLDGNVKIQVKVIANADAGESASATANNTTVSDVTVSVGKMLFLELPSIGVDENSTSLLKCKLSRSGNWSSTETFELAKSDDNRADVPTSVTIQKGQSAAYFYIKMIDNEVLDNDSVVTIAVSGNGYDEVEGKLIVVDNEYPDLTITTPKYEIAEGEDFQLHITTERVSPKPVTLYLTCDRAEHFKYPTQVILPAGEESVTVDVTAIEDNLPNVTLDAAFAVKAARYNSSECYIELLDNDLPEIVLTLTPNTISESAGPMAVMATLKRLTHNDNKVTVKLTDNSNGRLYYSTQTIVLESGVSEAQFTIGAIDNALVDGEQEITVTAAIYISSCDCAASGTTAGVVAQTIKVLDDDGPALKLSSSKSMLLEGAEEATVLTVSRNTDTTNPLTVTLASDADELLTYEKTVTIPAGKTSVNVPVAVKANDISSDSRTVVFTVKADNYTDGTCWAMITDQTLPDAVVTLSVDKAEIEAEEMVELKIVVKNIGVSTLLSTTPVEIAFSGANKNVELELGKSILPNDSVVLTYAYKLPALLGNYTFEAIVNSSSKIKELIYVNNRSGRVPIKLTPRFSVTASTDKEVYQQGDSVVISGTAIGSNGKNSDIEVYIINDGYRRTLMTSSDENGNYRVSWLPLSRQSGHFIVGACYPGANATGALDEFEVYGIRTGNDFSTCEFSEGENYSSKIVLYNPTNLPQTGLQVVAKGNSENCEFSFDYAKTINANQSIEIGFTIKGNDITEGKNWQQMPIEITTAEGSKLNYTIYYFVLPLKARLKVDQTSINTTMTYGVPRDYPIIVRNVGKGETGKISLALPDWIQASTPTEMASLAQGDSATIVLRFMPIDEMRLNMQIRGKVGINCSKGDGTYINFTLTPVSEAIGKLKVDVVDEYTYNTEEAPHVGNAQVQILHPTTGMVVAEGITNHDGTFTAELPEGWYTLKVNADKHDSYSNLVMVDPGTEKTEEVFLSYQAISVSWDVVETEIEDEYEIKTVVKYETNVPKPVIIVSMPDEKPEVNSVFPIILTNQGLVGAIEIQSSISTNKDYSLEFLNDPTLDVLAPGQSHIFYVIMKEPDSQISMANAKSRQSDNENECLRLVSDNRYKHDCDKYKKEENAKGDKAWGNCYNNGSFIGGISGPGGNGDGTGGSGGYGGYWGGGFGPGSPSLYPSISYDSDYDIDNRQPNKPKEFCDDKNKDNNGGNGDNGNPPDEVPDGETPENDDCDEEPKLVYELIPVDGSRMKMKGVAADGVSQVKIVLDPSKSVIPSEECGWTCQWTLENDNGKIGKLENTDSWDGVVYTAPEDFPVEEEHPTFEVKAKLTYSNGEISKEEVVNVIVSRVPLVLLHGLNADEGTWSAFQMNLIKRNLYKSFQIVNDGYKQTNCAHFSVNRKNNVVKTRIERALYIANENGFIASKVDLVGHSMGGILFRYYIADNGAEKVNKLITVNTPHSGSELGDVVKLAGPAKRKLVLRLFSALDAICDLAVDNSPIDDELNSTKTKSALYGVPIHAVVTQAGGRVENRIDYLARVVFWGSGYNFGDYLEESDDVVSVQSQEGGLNIPQMYYYWGPAHTRSPQDVQIWNQVQTLLRESKNAESFTKNGFHPINRHFPIKKTSYIRRQSVIRNSQEELVDINPVFEAHLVKDSLYATFTSGISPNSHLIMASFGENDVFVEEGTSLHCKIPTTFSGNLIVYGFTMSGVDRVLCDSVILNVESARTTLINVEIPEIHLTLGQDKQSILLCRWEDGSESYCVAESMTCTNNLIRFDNGKLSAIDVGTDTLIFSYKGHTCHCVATVYKKEEVNDESNSSSICSTITLSFDQKMVMTRQAFRGTLTVNNGHEENALKDFKLNLEVRDEDGVLATAHEFQINAESLKNFDGELSFDSGWSLAANETGVATILFIPTKYAAPTEPKEYSFGGTFSYTDPYNGLTVTRELNPVTLTVKPSPNLEMTYFMQRDIFGDDPLTTDVVEPMEPAEFSLLINNVGYGDATNVRMVTEQPKIIENEKGLLIDFELLSSQLNGGEQTLALGGSVPTEFGTIKAHSTAYAQWWLQSTLLGHFTEYDIKATHVTSYGNEDLSLLDTVTIHELIRSIKVPAEEKVLTGFLVNDIVDAEDMPDMLYLSDGTMESVSVTTAATISKNSDTEYLLTVAPIQAGWNYGSMVDPTNGKQDIVRVVRQSDGAEIDLRNIWQTDRTLRDGKDPLYENRIHFVDKFGTAEETYLLTFEPKAEVVLEVENFMGVPASDEVLKESLEEITVCFNKPIDATTFTTDDLTLNCQGKALDVSQIVITQVSDKEYTLDLSALSVLNGYYVLTVQTAGIVDHEGFVGETGKTASWVQYVGGKVNLMVKVTPENAGTVTPTAGLYDYEEVVTLTATANEGYEFLNWSSNDEVIATTPTYDYLMEGDAVIVATFAPKNYNVEVAYNAVQGVVTGSGTGVYQYGDALNLIAEPASGYLFEGWYVNDEKVAESLSYTYTVEGAAHIEARFTQVVYDLTLRLENGWNWISANFADEELMTSWKFLAPIKSSVERLVGMETEIVNDSEYGLTGNLKTLSPTDSYKLKVNRLTLNTWTGATVNADSTAISLKSGWNWIGYPSNIETSVSEALDKLKADEGDYIVGQDGFVEYADGQWIGTLSVFTPGKGYMYHSMADKDFTFNTVIYSKATPMYRTAMEKDAAWTADKYKYPSVMCVVADLYVADEVTDDFSVGAFCGTECRGVGKYVDGKLMMSIHGDNDGEITFYAMDNETEEVYNITEEIQFAEVLLGSVKKPYPLYVGNATGLSKVSMGWNVRLESGNLYLSLNGKTFDRVTLTDVYGNVVIVAEDVAQDEAIGLATLPDGVYIVTATQNDVMYYKKIMKIGK